MSAPVEQRWIFQKTMPESIRNTAPGAITTLSAPQIPYISQQEMIEVDRLMVEAYGINLLQMMENAGGQLAALARERFLCNRPAERKILVLAGSGGNGGGALVSARNFYNWGSEVKLLLTKSPDQLSEATRHQAKILGELGVDLESDQIPPESYHPDLIIDGLIGYNLQGSPRGRAADLINWANLQDGPILALDLPSGLHATTGEVFSPVIQAAATLTLALPKLGLKNAPQPVVGELYLADIGVPPILYAQPTLKMKVGPLFSKSSILRLN